MKTMGILIYKLTVHISNAMQVTTRKMKAFQHYTTYNFQVHFKVN